MHEVFCQVPMQHCYDCVCTYETWGVFFLFLVSSICCYFCYPCFRPLPLTTDTIERPSQVVLSKSDRAYRLHIKEACQYLLQLEDRHPEFRQFVEVGWEGHCCGVAVLWCCGAVVVWWCGAVVLSRRGVVVLLCCIVMM